MSIVTYVLVVAIELQSRRYHFLILTVAGKMFYKLETVVSLSLGVWKRVCRRLI